MRLFVFFNTPCPVHDNPEGLSGGLWQRTGLVLTFTHRYNAVRGHRTDSNNSGAENYPRRKNKQKEKIIHTITETNRMYTSDKNKR